MVPDPNALVSTGLLSLSEDVVVHESWTKVKSKGALEVFERSSGAETRVEEETGFRDREGCTRRDEVVSGSKSAELGVAVAPPNVSSVLNPLEVERIDVLADSDFRPVRVERSEGVGVVVVWPGTRLVVSPVGLRENVDGSVMPLPRCDVVEADVRLDKVEEEVKSGVK